MIKFGYNFMPSKKEKYTVGLGRTIVVDDVPMCCVVPLQNMSSVSADAFVEALVKVLNSHTSYIENTKKS
jgi:hypothetical protein